MKFQEAAVEAASKWALGALGLDSALAGLIAKVIAQTASLVANVAITEVNTAATAAATGAEAVNTASKAAGIVAINADTAATALDTAATVALTTAKSACAVAAAALSNPLAMVAGIAAVVTAGVIALASATDAQTAAFQNQIEAIEQDTAKIKEEAEAFEKLLDAQKKNIGAIESQYDHVSVLWAELKNLADANGVIAEKDLARAQVLAQLLNPTLGETIKLDKEHNKYVLANTEAIEKLIETKRAQAILAAKEPEYNKAVADSLATLNEQTRLNAEIDEHKLTMSNLIVQADQARIEGNDMLAASLVDQYLKEKELLEAKDKMYGELKGKLTGYYNTIADYENTVAAVQSGNFNTYLGIQAGTIDASKSTTDELVADHKKRIDTAQESYDTMSKATEKSECKISDIQLNAANARVQAEKDAMLAMLLASASGGKDLKDEHKAIAKDMLDSYKDLPDDQRKAGLLSMLGMIKGLEEKVPALEKAGEMSAEQLMKAVEGALGIASPSKEMEAIGSNTIEGLKGGLVMRDDLKAESVSVGSDMGQGILSGLAGKEEAIMEKARAIARRALQTIQSALEIHSPSKATARLGQQLGEGLAQGMSQSAGSTARSFESDAKSLMKSMKTAVISEMSRISLALGERGNMSSMQLSAAAVTSGSNTFNTSYQIISPKALSEREIKQQMILAEQRLRLEV